MQTFHFSKKKTPDWIYPISVLMTNIGVSLNTMGLTLIWSQSCIQSRKATPLWAETSPPSLGRSCGPVNSSTEFSSQCSFSSSSRLCCRRRKPDLWFEVTTGWPRSSWSLRFFTTGHGSSRWVSTFISFKDLHRQISGKPSTSIEVFYSLRKLVFEDIL